MRIASALALALSLAAPLSSVACAPEGSEDASSADEVRTARLRRSDLPRGQFRTRAEELGQEWIDGNIMTGDARLDAGEIGGRLSEAALFELAERMVVDHLKRSDLKLTGTKTASVPFRDALLKQAAKVVAIDGFVFAENPDNIGPIEDNVRELTKFLGSTSTLDAVTLKGKATGEGMDSDHDGISLWLFVNRETKQFVAFYAREGTV